MITVEPLLESRSMEPLPYLELAQKVLASQSLDEFLTFALPWIADMTRSDGVFLYIAPKRTLLPVLHHRGLAPDEVPYVEDLCHKELNRLAAPPCDSPRPDARSRLSHRGTGCELWPIPDQPAMRGILGLAPGLGVFNVPLPVWDVFISFFGSAVSSFFDRMKSERQIAFLNTYLTVSSLLAQSVRLHELMETALYFCTDVVSAQEASVLLLDESREKLTFFQTEGASRSALMGLCFSVEKGIAGSVLRERKSEIVNDVQQDPRFFRLFDSVSGVSTRNMIAIPLVAGEETVGVLEAINKSGGFPFSDEDHLLLRFIAEEMAFGVRNARIFEVLANSYCRQRQGLGSCRDCVRPLGSWTPCLKHRESLV